ncbi:hypothetical protein ABZ490_22950 [Streptomyces sp. NPDC005811]|uniref:hypothetical protein n=1 Tax=Streptomyces sp. NPDC005811 TaxID=3154565 RepID=UPI0033C02D26
MSHGPALAVGGSRRPCSSAQDSVFGFPDMRFGLGAAVLRGARLHRWLWRAPAAGALPAAEGFTATA